MWTRNNWVVSRFLFRYLIDGVDHHDLAIFMMALPFRALSQLVGAASKPVTPGLIRKWRVNSGQRRWDRSPGQTWRTRKGPSITWFGRENGCGSCFSPASEPLSTTSVIQIGLKGRRNFTRAGITWPPTCTHPINLNRKPNLKPLGTEQVCIEGPFKNSKKFYTLQRIAKTYTQVMVPEFYVGLLLFVSMIDSLVRRCRVRGLFGLIFIIW